MRSWLGEGIRAQQWLSVCAGRQDMVLATVLLIAIVMMLLPLPTWMVDNPDYYQPYVFSDPALNCYLS